MRIVKLTAERVRNLGLIELQPGPDLNLLIGANGAGKTSILEAVHLLAFGRSFRGRVRDGLIQTGADSLEVFVELIEPAGEDRTLCHRLGLRHTGAAWEGRIDGSPVGQLGLLCSHLAVLTFEPGSHALVSGGGEPRRRFLDWGLFHVERDMGAGFLAVWRRYARALKQRNALLRQGAGPAQLDAWDQELATAGERLNLQRNGYAERLQPWLARIAAQLAPDLGTATLMYQAGWRRDQLSLADALLLARERDRASGYTSVGPHRADWRVRHAGRPGDEALSRGQAKLTALACLLAQGEDYAAVHGAWPIVLLDDLASELDRDHQARLLERLLASKAQIFMTGTECPPALDNAQDRLVMFHVERGSLRLTLENPF